jgi:prepilin-type N-terminal cleavage/methylation domain-containing protein
VTRRNAFTLVEVMTVLLIVGFGLLPVLTLMRGTTRQEALDESVVVAQAMAVRLTEATVEELHRTGFKPIERSGGPEAVGLAPGQYGHDLTAEATDPEAFLWRVKVVVRWTLPTDKGPDPTHVYELERLVSRPDAAFTGAYPYRREVAP